MASTAPAERFHIVLAPEEKRRWTASAAAVGLPTSEYVRRAVDAYRDEDRLTPDERAQIQAAMDEAVAAAHEIRATVAEIREIVARPFDEEAAFAEGQAAFAAQPFALDFAHLKRSEAA